MKGRPAGKKNAIVILNGISLRKKLFYHEYLPALSEVYDVEVHETLSRNDARSLASRFTDKYVDIIISAGGDGTLNQVVNGILKDRENETKLPGIGVIPIGSGNDFMRGAVSTLNVPETLRSLSQNSLRPVDVGLIEYCLTPDKDSQRSSAYFVNVADIGMGPEVVRKVLGSGRPFGSGVAYFKSIVNTFLTYKPMVVRAASDDWTWEGKLRTLAVANGKYYGHGLCIAPDARMDDRSFSVFICGNVSLLDFMVHGRSLRRDKKVQLDKVHYKTTTALELTSEAPCPIEGDGEILGWLPARISMIPRQLNFIL